MLSSRAKRFLATLERRSSVPIGIVESIFLNQGSPCFTAWLEFHEQYAGYVERFGRDGAIWGLVHDSPQWLLSCKADIDREPHEEVWYITCADAHPSYSYRLDDKGEFLGAPAESFDIHVERIAAAWDFYQRTQSRLLSRAELRTLDFRETLTQMDLVPEASDGFSRYYMNDAYLLVEDAKSRKLRKGSISSNKSG